MSDPVQASRPTTFSVLGQPFTIEYVDSTIADKLGQTITTEQHVAIRNEQGPDQERDTMLHELLHACIQVGGIRIGNSRREEMLVRTLSPVLLDCLRRSPELVEYLLA